MGQSHNGVDNVALRRINKLNLLQSIYNIYGGGIMEMVVTVMT